VGGRKPVKDFGNCQSCKIILIRTNNIIHKSRENSNRLVNMKKLPSDPLETMMSTLDTLEDN
jgi:hypothetical protein